MKLIEVIQEILLAFCIAIMVPVVAYWGVQTFYSKNSTQGVVGYNSTTVSQNVEQVIVTPKVELEKKQKQDNVHRGSFLVYLVAAVLAILAGSFIKINSLSMGFIGGGVINILLSLVYSSNNPITNLGIFLFLFLVLILIIIMRKKYKES